MRALILAELSRDVEHCCLRDCFPGLDIGYDEVVHESQEPQQLSGARIATYIPSKAQGNNKFASLVMVHVIQTKPKMDSPNLKWIEHQSFQAPVLLQVSSEAHRHKETYLRVNF